MFEAAGLLPCPPKKRPMRDAEPPCRFPCRDIAACPRLPKCFICLWPFLRWTTKSDAARLCRRDALALPLAAEFPLRLRDIGEQGEHDVRNQPACEVAAAPRIKDGQVEHDDGAPLLLRQVSPFLHNRSVIPPETVNALHDERISCTEPPPEPLICRP